MWRLIKCAETGKIDFDAFVAIASNFLEEEDDEAMLNELKEAFRLYDKEGSIVDYGWFQDIQMILLHSIGVEGNGYITTQTLREILAALDDKLTALDLDGMIAEIDTDGSGTVDFDEFMEMMVTMAMIMCSHSNII